MKLWKGRCGLTVFLRQRRVLRSHPHVSTSVLDFRASRPLPNARTCHPQTQTTVEEVVRRTTQVVRTGEVGPPLVPHTGGGPDDGRPSPDPLALGARGERTVAVKVGPDRSPREHRDAPPGGGGKGGGRARDGGGGRRRRWELGVGADCPRSGVRRARHQHPRPVQVPRRRVIPVGDVVVTPVAPELGRLATVGPVRPPPQAQDVHSCVGKGREDGRVDTPTIVNLSRAPWCSETRPFFNAVLTLYRVITPTSMGPSPLCPLALNLRHPRP